MFSLTINPFFSKILLKAIPKGKFAGGVLQIKTNIYMQIYLWKKMSQLLGTKVTKGYTNGTES